MDNKSIAEFTTRIIEAAVANEKIIFSVETIAAAYEKIFDTIKQKDNE